MFVLSLRDWQHFVMNITLFLWTYYQIIHKNSSLHLLWLWYSNGELSLPAFRGWGFLTWHLKEKFYIRNSLFYHYVLNAFSIVRKHCIIDNFMSVFCRYLSVFSLHCFTKRKCYDCFYLFACRPPFWLLCGFSAFGGSSRAHVLLFFFHVSLHPPSSPNQMKAALLIFSFLGQLSQLSMQDHMHNFHCFTLNFILKTFSSNFSLHHFIMSLFFKFGNLQLDSKFILFLYFQHSLCCYFVFLNSVHIFPANIWITWKILKTYMIFTLKSMNHLFWLVFIQWFLSSLLRLNFWCFETFDI